MEWPISWNDVKEALENSSGGGSSTTIVNLDEHPVVYDVVGARIQMGGGEHTVGISTLRNELSRFWGALDHRGNNIFTCTINGDKVSCIPIATKWDLEQDVINEFTLQFPFSMGGRIAMVTVVVRGGGYMAGSGYTALSDTKINVNLTPFAPLSLT